MITELSATEMAHRIREGTLSPVQVVEAHISRIEQTTAAINAVVTPTFEQARQRAHEAEAARKRGELWGPLHGVPFTAKDSYDVAGVRSTGGLVSREGHFPTTDALLVARLRAAGAILLGKTNTPSNAGAYETRNLVFGLTTNPWNVTRSAGGSTGGEAAIIAAGGSPLGIGSDLAGSIRLPSAFNGIVGLRPTSNALATEGFWPPITGRIADLNALGPMARRVEDVGLGWDVLNEHDPQPIDTAVLRGQRVVYWFSDGTLPVSNAVRGGVNAAVRALEQAGMQPVANAPAGRIVPGLRMGSTGGPKNARCMIAALAMASAGRRGARYCVPCAGGHALKRRRWCCGRCFQAPGLHRVSMARHGVNGCGRRCASCLERREWRCARSSPPPHPNMAGRRGRRCSPTATPRGSIWRACRG
ncbi:MAG: hypothetical protein HC876_18980 [Chloroflexaceae bacterium]|nr:hypothetical protein [Chloroflexaceae bacterium]